MDKRTNLTMNKNYVEDFATMLRLQRYAESSIKTYTSHLSYFLKLSAKYDPEDITQKQLEGFVIWLVEKKKVGMSYQKAMIATIGKFYKETFQRPVNLKHLYPQRNVVNKLPKFLTKMEVKKILNSISNIKHKAILTTIYSCGLRLGELLELKKSDIKTEQNIVLIRKAKGKKDRVVMLSPKLIELLREYYKIYNPKKYLFEGSENEKYSQRSVQQIMKSSLKKSGVASPASVYTLRHSYATHLLENGMDIKTIKELLGHDNIKTTEIYTRIKDVIKSRIGSPLDSL